jgi:hypothetical protein
MLIPFVTGVYICLVGQSRLLFFLQATLRRHFEQFIGQQHPCIQNQPLIFFINKIHSACLKVGFTYAQNSFNVNVGCN